jgi:hypothetical protein
MNNIREVLNHANQKIEESVVVFGLTGMVEMR